MLKIFKWDLTFCEFVLLGFPLYYVVIIPNIQIYIVGIIILFYRWIIWGSKKLSDLSKNTGLLSEKAESRTKKFWHHFSGFYELEKQLESLTSLSTHHSGKSFPLLSALPVSKREKTKSQPKPEFWSCGWRAGIRQFLRGMKEVAVGSHFVFLPLDNAWVRGLAENRWPLLKRVRKASLMKALFTKVWKELRECAKKWKSVLGLKTVGLEAAKSWGYWKGTPSPQYHCQQRGSGNKHPNSPPMLWIPATVSKALKLTRSQKAKGLEKAIRCQLPRTRQYGEGRTLHLVGKERLSRRDFPVSSA